MSAEVAARPRVVILGVGNLLQSDEGVGPQFVGRFERSWTMPATALLIDGGTSAMELLDELACVDLLLVVDAVSIGAQPGTVVVLKGERVPEFFSLKISPHQVGLLDALAALRLQGESPSEIVILGVEPGVLDLSMELSPTVQDALPRLEAIVLERLRGAGIEPLPRELAQAA